MNDLAELWYVSADDVCPAPRRTAVRSLPSVASAVSALKKADAGVAVELVAPRDVITFDVLEDLTRAALDSGARIGLVPAEISARTFQRESARSDQGSHWAVCDALRGTLRGSGLARGADIRSVFEKQWDLVCFVGHGDGSHVNLGGAVLCGLDGSAELLGDVPLTGGCRWAPASCKKQSMIPEVFQLGRLRADTVLLLSCTSFSVGRQVYPSNLSLVLAASISGGRYVIGTTRQVKFGEETVAHVLDLMARLPSMGDVVAELNGSRELAEDGAMVLLGNPAGRPPSEAARGALPECHELSAANSHVRSHVHMTKPIDAAEVSEQLSQELSATADLARSLVSLEQFIRAMRWLARINGDSADPVRVALDQAERARRAGLEITFRRRFSLLTGASDRLSGREKHESRLQLLDDAVIALLRTRVLDESTEGGGVGDLVAPALTLLMDRTLPKRGPDTCQHCKGSISIARITDPTTAVSRIRRTCSACGVLADSPFSEFGISAVNDPVSGPRVEFRLRAPQMKGSQRALLQVRDKTKRAAFRLLEVEVADGTLLPFEIPACPGSDQWTARVVAVGNGQISYARCVFSFARNPRHSAGEHGGPRT